MCAVCSLSCALWLAVTMRNRLIVFDSVLWALLSLGLCCCGRRQLFKMEIVLWNFELDMVISNMGKYLISWSQKFD